jgi:hypothetical protein
LQVRRLACLLESGHLALSSSTLPPFATHFLKYARWSLPDPLALPAAGFPGSRGGNCLAVRTLHFLASSAVIAEARSGTQPSTMQVSASSVRPDAKLPNMTPLPLLAATARSAHQSFAPTPPIILAGFGMDERPCSRPATWSDFPIHAASDAAKSMSSGDLTPNDHDRRHHRRSQAMHRAHRSDERHLLHGQQEALTSF